MAMPYFYIGLVASLSTLVIAGTNDQVGANLSYGTFQNPSAEVRPRFRYWLPDASVDPAIVQDDIRSAGSVGAGGVEFLPFYNYGGELGTGGPGTNIDWAKYGFGTEAFKAMFLAALEAHKANGLKMDFALGPNQGQGVPAEEDDEGLQWDLAPFAGNIPPNGSFYGSIPGWGAGKLVSLVSAEVLSIKNMSLPNPITLLPAEQSSNLQLILRNGTLKNHADQIKSDGHATIKLPPIRGNSTYKLFAFYEYQTGTKNVEVHKEDPKTIFDNGSYVVDHYSSCGAQTITNFWETYILTPEVRKLLSEVGNYAWEDSVEARFNISWTPSLPARFEESFGYDLKTFLPLIMFANNNLGLQETAPGPTQCLLDIPDGGQGHVNNYRAVLASGYRQYLQSLTSWVNSYLNLQMSAQVSYNFSMDMEANIPFVNAPECESLGFKDSIDMYRQYSGPAVLAGKRVISNEMGAVALGSHSYPISQLLWSINRAVVGGVNQFVVHGQSYTGNYTGTTWPGYTAFGYVFSENYSNKQPAWDNGFSDVLKNYVSRVSYTQQTGRLLTDVAIYNKLSAWNNSLPEVYTDTDLAKNGYTYNYLSPENFNLPHARVINSRLAPEGPSYKALVVIHTSKLTREAVRKLQKYASQGLPVVFSGGDPSPYLSARPGAKFDFQHALASLKRTPNVYSVPAGKVAEKLTSLGIHPNIHIKSNGTWYPTWRQDRANSISYCFVFNDANQFTTGTIDIATTGTPYLFDPWTGKQSPILHYQRLGNRTTLPLRLAANQTVIVAFTDRLLDTTIPDFHIAQAPSTVLEYRTDNSSSKIQALVPAGTWDTPLTLSNGKKYTSANNLTTPPSFPLQNWTLVAEHWEAPSNLLDASVTAVKHNTTHQLADLISWTEIPALVNVSGVGYYRTSFSWPPTNGSADGAYIRLPPIHHAARLYVNGMKTTALGFSSPSMDITAYLTLGHNTVVVEVPSTMWNYIRSIMSEIRFMGEDPSLRLGQIGGLPGVVQNGLIGEVEIVPFVAMDLP